MPLITHYKCLNDVYASLSLCIESLIWNLCQNLHSSSIHLYFYPAVSGAYTQTGSRRVPIWDWACLELQSSKQEGIESVVLFWSIPFFTEAPASWDKKILSSFLSHIWLRFSTRSQSTKVRVKSKPFFCPGQSGRKVWVIRGKKKFTIFNENHQNKH